MEGARDLVGPELRAAVESLPTPLRRVARHHLGWEQPDGSPAAGTTGTAPRSALVLAAADALGGTPARDSAVRAAAAVELVHTVALLHDDATDRDVTGRHRPTAGTMSGDADALLAGDALQALAFGLLAEDPHPASTAAAARLAACVVELCPGRHTDITLGRRSPGDMDLDDVLAMAEARTGALLGCACAVGALYAGATAEDVEALEVFGREAGLAFRLIDDVIGIWGDPGCTGKPAGADLAVREMPLPAVAALVSGTTAAVRPAEWQGQGTRRDPADVGRTAPAVERAGGRDWAQEEAADRMSRAVGALAHAVPEPERAGGLLSLAELVTRRGA
ncbi:polyprenyl synthetase family protein [Streptomyces sp. NPDC028635]|uniref:polyprenyl synthetase family protein n=1 Tax=Streptomyces sp. NPDC028635 TaxID=3154800 RepID=UPI0033FE0F24